MAGSYRPDPKADPTLCRAGVTVLPDIYTNAGGVTVSYLKKRGGAHMFRFSLFLVLPALFLRGETLTLLQVLQLADAKHPQLRASEAQIAIAEAGIKTAKAYPNPFANVGAGRQFVRVPGNVTGLVTTFGVEQPIERRELRNTRFRFADRLRESSEVALSQTRLGVLSGVRRAFFQILRRREEIEMARENLKLVEDLRQRIQVRVDVGEAGRLELIRAEAEVAAARTLVNSVELQLITANSQLQAAVGTPLPQDLTLAGSLDPPRVLPALDEVRQEAIGRHPAILLAQAEVRRAESRIPYEQALGRPQPSVRTDYDIFPDVPNVRLSLSLPLPVWNKREGPIAEAVANSRRADALARAQQIEILAALEGAFGRYQLATQQLALFETGLLREAQEALRAAGVAYQLGERGILEVLDAQRVLRQVRLNFLNAQYERQSALVDLDELRGLDLRGYTP